MELYTCSSMVTSLVIRTNSSAKRPRDASCLSVVSFELTLSLLVINISSSSPAINTAATSDVSSCETVADGPWSTGDRIDNTWPVAALTQAVKPDIGSKSRFLPTSPAFDVPVIPSEYCYAVWHEKN